ncbi:MAG: DUF4980 domain-containing protein [Bacteroidales bacterium]|nr:DUF4980 domain-containing protein [Bacteroidales bacterium]MBQ4407519.1 DUF4980 domain-containing protein [Bacteroidales bacterium]
MKRIFLSIAAACVIFNAAAQQTFFSGGGHVVLKDKAQKTFLLLPVQENKDGANIQIISDGKVEQSLNVKLAVDKIDYFVPLSIEKFSGKNLVFDIEFWGGEKQTADVKNYLCWKEIHQSNDFDTQNKEHFRPEFHHTPLYGWMNDPNGMFYFDGKYHLYYQWNPYGSQWENMTWGHSVSNDLVNWSLEQPAILPDGLGTIFSGSCVVDKNNSAGFGKNAVIAFYTSAGRNQTQSMAYSTDGGKTFSKYEGNPVLTDENRDFRDPKVFFNESINRWNMILAVGQEMKIYSSLDLKNWNYESSFGQGFGCHDGVWECPDLMKIGDKWLLICNINPGGIFGGSATQYFIGDFDGKKFVTTQKDTKWLDYGKDHYATVTFSNAPDNRKIALAWMSNWQYGNEVPTKQFRSANSVPRDLFIFEADGEKFCGSKPSDELLKLRQKVIKTPSETCEILATLKGDAKITLSNTKNENVTITYNAKTKVLTFNRKQSGEVSFSKDFAAETSVKVPGGSKTLRIFVDKCSIEVFDGEGKAVMTNLVFPSEYYSLIATTGCKTIIYQLQK